MENLRGQRSRFALAVGEVLKEQSNCRRRLGGPYDKSQSRVVKLHWNARVANRIF
jgi:hypothetical protein